jgi:chromatin segregation and condensation protein Rec8/ScpA/Scc1 (kleisin family)
MSFSGLLITEKATRVEIVGIFLALLELVKHYRVMAKQDVLFEDIDFERSEDWKDDEEIEIEFE